MARAKYPPGLVTGFKITQRCDKCDLLLESSKINNVLVAYRYCTRNKLYCIKCSMHKTRHVKQPKITIEDVDRFLCRLLGDKN